MPATNRVHVNVVDHRKQSGWLDNVSVESTTLLPKVIADSVSLCDSDSRQPFRCMLPQIIYRFAAHRFFDALPDDFDLIDRPSGVDNQMHVFGHENERPQIEVELFPCRDNRISQPFARAFRFEELKSTETRKRQLVSVPRFVVVLPMSTALCTERSTRRKLSRSHDAITERGVAGSERCPDEKHCNQNNHCIRVGIDAANVKRWPCERRHAWHSGPSLDSRASATE